MMLDKRFGKDIIHAELGKVIGTSPDHRILQSNMGIKQNLDRIGQLVLHAQVGFGMEQVDQRVGKRCFLLVNGLQHVPAHHDRIVVEQRHQQVDAGCSDGRPGVLYGKRDDGEKAMADEIGVQGCTRRRLQVFCDGRALVEELHRVVFASRVGVSGIEDGKQVLQEPGIRLDVVHDLYLVVENQRVENRERRIVQYPCQHHILQVL